VKDETKTLAKSYFDSISSQLSNLAACDFHRKVSVTKSTQEHNLTEQSAGPANAAQQ
jgi:hypothetical protein